MKLAIILKQLVALKLNLKVLLIHSSYKIEEINFSTFKIIKFSTNSKKDSYKSGSVCLGTGGFKIEE